VCAFGIPILGNKFSDTGYVDDSNRCDFDPKNRLVTSSRDGYLRLYSSASDNFSLVTKSNAPGGLEPLATVFSPTGDKIAVGFVGSTKVNVLDGHDLKFLYAPNTTAGIAQGDLGIVAWSQDGNSLYAGGTYDGGSFGPLILHWSQAGKGNYTEWQASTDVIVGIHSLKNGGIIYGTGNPTFAVLDNMGIKIMEQETSIIDYRGMLFRKGIQKQNYNKPSPLPAKT
jgi:WD40 repeat protein